MGLPALGPPFPCSYVLGIQIKTRAKNAKKRPAPRGRFSTLKNVNGHLKLMANINMKEKKKEKKIYLKITSMHFTYGQYSVPNTLIMRLIFDFCQFPQLCLIC